MEVCIIGGGVLGLACAWRLAQSGCQVTLLERHQCGSGASTAALGALWASTAARTVVHHLHHNSLSMMQGFCDELHDDSGIHCGYERCGRIELVTNPKRSEQIKSELMETGNVQQLWNINSVTEFINKDQLTQLEPNVAWRDEEILQCHITAKLDSIKLIDALKQACINVGVAIHENTRVDKVIIENEQVQSVNTPNQSYQAKKLLITAGAWIPMLGETIHQQAPVKPVRGQGILFRAHQPLISHIIKKDSIYLIPREDNHIMVGSTTEPNSGYDDGTTEEGIAFLTQGAAGLIPQLKEAEVVKTWAGLRPMGMDKRPFLGEAPDIKNLYFAAGFYKTGLGMAPVASQIVCDLMVGKEIENDICGLRPGRISFNPKNGSRKLEKGRERQ